MTRKIKLIEAELYYDETGLHAYAKSHLNEPDFTFVGNELETYCYGAFKEFLYNKGIVMLLNSMSDLFKGGRNFVGGSMDDVCLKNSLVIQINKLEGENNETTNHES